MEKLMGYFLHRLHQNFYLDRRRLTRQLPRLHRQKHRLCRHQLKWLIKMLNQFRLHQAHHLGHPLHPLQPLQHKLSLCLWLQNLFYNHLLHRLLRQRLDCRHFHLSRHHHQPLPSNLQIQMTKG
jgi:hypothetical protein